MQEFLCEGRIRRDRCLLVRLNLQTIFTVVFTVLLSIPGRVISFVQPSSFARPRQMPSTRSAGTSLGSESMPEHVVIAGAGVVGLSTAFYLATNYNTVVRQITLIDVTGTIAPAASGKAGGFLAMDWNDGSPTQQLTRRSFTLHQELADVLGADTIDYRRLTCAAIGVNSGNQKPKGKKLEGVEWVNDSNSIRSLGSTETIAQVHPKKLCNRLWQVTQELVECQLKKGKAVSVVNSDEDDNELIGAKLEDGTVIECDAILFSCGPWTTSALKSIPMFGIKYHSAVVPTSKVLSQCVFFSGCGDPEVYVRPDQTAYLTGFPESPRPVTETPGQEQILDEKISTILKSVEEASGSSKDGDPNIATFSSDDPRVLKQSCYLPSTNDGVPVMGAVRKNVFVAAGHSCWGILLGPATGESMASLICNETPKINLQRFTPSRYF